MQATETKLRKLIEGTTQYVVPLFQRPYSWAEKQWKVLLSDVLDQSRHDDGRPHFFGSIVTSQARSVPQGVGKHLLIDGQQRITTIQVFLAAVRDVAKRIGETRLASRIDGQYLINGYEEGDERLKVLPTNDDRAAFAAIILGGEVPPGRLASCRQFFLSRLDQAGPARLESIHLAIVDRLSLVAIACDEYDNPHLIFESLNAKGEKLTPADLIRNFLLMRVHVKDQKKLFDAHWLPIQQALVDDLTEFVRHYLMRKGQILKEADVYFELKDLLAHATPAEAEAFLRDLHRHGMFYAKFVDPRRETDPALSERLDRIRRLKVTVAFPFLLRVFDAHDSRSLTRDQVIQTLDVVESFVMRRSICNLPTNQLRRMFPPVFDAAGGAGPGFIDGVRRQLGGSRCPDDEAFAQSLKTEPLYAGSEKNARLRLILERLEASFNHKESADPAAAQIEHILPQTLTADWARDLGEDEREASSLLHTLGNLTLTGYNAEMSNKTFGVKRKELAKSHFVLNRGVSEVERWSSGAIRARGHALAERALSIWPDVGRPPSPEPAAERRAAGPPDSVRFREKEQPAANWKDAFIKLLKCFEEFKPGLLRRIATEQELPAVITSNADRFRRSHEEIGGVYVNTHASAANLKDWCRKVAEIGEFQPAEYAFVMPEDSPNSTPVADS